MHAFIYLYIYMIIANVQLTCSILLICLERCSGMSWVSRVAAAKARAAIATPLTKRCVHCVRLPSAHQEFPNVSKISKNFAVIPSLSSLEISLLQASPPVKLKHNSLIILMISDLFVYYYILLQVGTVATRWQFAEN